MSDAVLTLSRYVQPQVRLGGVWISTQSMDAGEDRAAYLVGMADHLNNLLGGVARGRVSIENVLEFRDTLPFGAEHVEIVADGGRMVARLKDTAIDSVHFRAERLGLLMLDGRERRVDPMVYLPTGHANAAFGRFFPMLARGASEAALRAAADRNGVAYDDEVWDELRGRGVVEVGPPEDRTDPALRPTGRERLTWLGHAAALFQTATTNVLVDPLLRPHIAWRNDEIEEVFSEDFVDSRLIDDYGPQYRQVSLHDLPRVDAVVVTHQDRDHFDLGVLMALPEDAVIVVPKCRADRPWEVDMKRTIANVLGPARKVVELGHGETLRVGDVTVRALPFRGEFPSALPHDWNTYVLETERRAVVFFADCAVGPEQIDAVAEAVGDSGRETYLLSFPAHPDDLGHSHRFAEGPLVALQSHRLWPWYIPLWNHFSRVRLCGVGFELLAALRARVDLRGYFPYAVGGTPTFRMTDDPFRFGLDTVTPESLELIFEGAERVGVGRLGLRYGVPHEFR